MALTKIKLNTMVTGTLPDANIPDDITIDTAAAVPASGLTGNTLASGVTASSLTSVGTLTSFAVSHSSDFGSFTSTLQYPILKLNSTYGSAAGNGYLDFQRDGTTAARVYQTNQELRFATGGTTDALTLDSSQNATFAGRINVTEIKGSELAIKDANADLMAYFQDGSSRLYSSGYNLRLEASNELNLYNANTPAELFINHSGTGSAVNIADSELQVVKGTGSTFAGDVKINSDSAALVLGANQDTSIFSDSEGILYFARGTDRSLSSSDTEGWFAFQVGNNSETFAHIVGGEGGVSSLYFSADQADNNNDRWRLQANTGGDFTISTLSSGSYESAIAVDDNGKVGIKTTSPNVSNYTAERGVLTISSQDNASANNYAVLELQGHSMANNVGLGSVSFLDHTAQVALIQGERQNNSQSAKLSFYTSETGPSIQRRMTIYDAGHVEVTNTLTANKNSKFELWMNTGDNGRSAALHHDTLKFSIEKFDVNDDTSHVNNKTRFTAPANGYYYLSFSGNANVSAGGGAVLYFTFHKNGSANPLYYYYGMTGGTAAGWKYITGNVIIELSANDYIHVESRVSGGTHYWDASSSTGWTFFRGFRLT